MGSIERAFSTLLRHKNRQQAHVEEPIETCPGPREPGSVLPDQDPLCAVLRGAGRRLVRADISRDFELRQADVLGTGSTGSVVLAEHRSTKQKVAVKSFLKSKLTRHQLDCLKREVKIGLEVDHPNVCKLLHVYEKGDKVWMVMELCRCDLYEHVRQFGAPSETRAREAIRQMLRAVAYLHANNIVHRDLKLENWMYSSGEGSESLKLIDFGFSTRLMALDEEMESPCGTLHYVSPEVLKQKYTSQADMWSMGVVCYIVLTGRMPFSGPKEWRIAQDIQTGSFRKDGRWCQLPAQAQDLVRRLLVVEPAERLTAEQALQHPWLAERSGSARALRPSQLQDVSESLWHYGQGSSLQRAALRVLAGALPSSELVEAEQSFAELDAGNTGTLPREGVKSLLQLSRPEASAHELDAVVDRLDCNGAKEVTYTSFVAAMLSTRSHQHEKQVRHLFSTFDVEGTGFLTARSLRSLFSSNPADASPKSADTPLLWVSEGLPQSLAEAWVAEVDYRGNGSIDVEGFVLALSGKPRVPPSLQDDRPEVQVFDVPPAAAADAVPSPCNMAMAGAAWASAPTTREPSIASSDEYDQSSMSSWSKDDSVCVSHWIVDI